MSSECQTSNTLYPKIGKLKDVVYRSRSLDQTSLSLFGTVKLHGTHADIVIEKGNVVRFQSRNRLELALGGDNSGFAAFAIPLRSRILALKEKYIARYISLNPGIPLDPEQPVVIAGEWCGKGIQKKVAIVQLPKQFVIVSVSINGTWVPDDEYANINDESVGIYNISKAGFFYRDVNLDNIEKSEEEIAALVAQVEKECPYASTFGVSGIGEGIVWKVLDHCEDPEFWFKSKGDEFAVKTVEKSAPDLLKLQDRERAEEFGKGLVTENRMEQGWGYLAEMGIPRDMKGMSQFLSWLVKDCLTEEKLDIAEAKIDVKQLTAVIISAGREWYTAKVKPMRT